MESECRENEGEWANDLIWKFDALLSTAWCNLVGWRYGDISAERHRANKGDRDVHCECMDGPDECSVVCTNRGIQRLERMKKGFLEKNVG